MSRPPRGTVVSVRFINDDRPKKWGVFWNEYEEGRVGRPKQRARFYADEVEAERVAKDLRLLLAAGTSLPAPTVPTHRAADTLAAFADEVWLPFVKERNAGATHKNYADSFKNWVAPQLGHQRYPGLGNVILSNETFTTRIIVEYLERLHKAGVSLSMRRRIKTAISACCGHALYVGWLSKVPNPCTQIGRRLRHKGEEAQEAAANPFAPAEITRIFDQLAAVEDLCWQVYFLWQYHVGTRPGEASALKWTALELDKNRARINYSYCSVDQIDKDPKTHERRTVELTAVLIERLIEWRRVQREVAFSRGLPVPEYVFTTRQAGRGVPRQLARILQTGAVRAVLQRTLAACAISGHTLYDFRDSFATSHLVLGWDRKLAWVSKQLGHKTPLTTAKHYYGYRDTSASASFADEIGGWK